MELFAEEDARRTVELRDDHALGTVDDERPLVRDQGQLAQIDLGFLNVADLELRVLLVFVLFLDDELHAHLQGSGEGQAAFLAFLDAELGLPQGVAQVFDRQVPTRGSQWEDRAEHGSRPESARLSRATPVCRNSL